MRRVSLAGLAGLTALLFATAPAVVTAQTDGTDPDATTPDATTPDATTTGQLEAPGEEGEAASDAPTAPTDPVDASAEGTVDTSTEGTVDASAEEARAPRSSSTAEPPSADGRALRTTRREVPDLDGRPEPGPDAGEVLLWIPRILFGPLTLLLDYGIRRPLGFLAEAAERDNWTGFLFDMVTWNERRSGLMPTFFVAFGMQPSAGLYYFSNDEIAQGHQVRLSAAFGGVDYLNASGAYRVVTNGGRVRIGLSGGGGRRPDQVFSGTGWDSQAEQYRFREAQYSVRFDVLMRPWRESELTVTAGVDGHDFETDGYAALAASPNNQTLQSAIDSNAVVAPAGLQGHVAYRQRVELAIDSREPEPAPGHGIRVEGYGELAFDLNRPLERQWARYGGGIGGFVDAGHRRVFGLWVVAHFADPLGSGPVPFTELVTLGGDALLLSGFLNGQLRGRSGTAATLEYTYPVWTQLNARLHVGVGNAFGPQLGDFAFERLRLSFGFGLSVIGDPDNSFELGVAAGTAPFVSGGEISSVQLLFGSRQGF